MGFLDMFDDPNILSRLLGGGGSAAAAPPTPQAPPTPPAPPSFPPVQDLSTAPSGTAMQGGFPAAQGFDPHQAASATQGGFPVAQGFDNSIPMPPNPQGQNIPLPRPRPNIELPPNATPTIGSPPAGPPLSLSPPMPPVSQMQPGNAPQTMSAGGGLAAALGLNNGGLRPALAGVGRGLSAVGQMQPGTPAGQAFAAGAGGSLQGAEASRTQQEQLARQKQNDLFTQSSTAFKDMLAAKNSDNTETYRQAQSKYLMARAQSLMTGEGGRGALKTPEQKVAYVENQALRMRDQYRKTAEMNARTSGAPVDEDKIDKMAETYRQNLYKHFKIDPAEAEKIKTMGLEPPKVGDKPNPNFNPFDARKMTPDQFHSSVPLGAWYLDENGKPKQRVVPPPGHEGGAAGPRSDAAPSGTDDYMAMTPAA